MLAIALLDSPLASIHRRPQPLSRAEFAAGIAGLRGAKTRHPGGADQDARASAGIAPVARGSFANVEAAKAVEADDAAVSNTCNVSPSTWPA